MQTQDNLIDRLKTELCRDKKRAAILAALLLVGAIVAGKAVLGGPHNASGAARAVAVAPAAAPAPGDAAGTPVTPASARVGRDLNAYIRQIDRSIARDIFRVSAELFPPDTSTIARVVTRNADDSQGWFEQLDAMLAGQEQAVRAQADRSTTVRAQAQALALQSTMMGSNPTALINGQVLRAGEWVNGFRVESVKTGRCVVSKDDVLVELRMKN